jgi:hypothetical protein
MNDNFQTARKLKQLHSESKTSKEKQQSKDRLERIACKKMQTIMIGSLDTIEKTFGFLWEIYDEDTEETVNEKMEMLDLFNGFRKSILDRGNAQINIFKQEMEQYDVIWNRYQMEIPYKPIRE